MSFAKLDSGIINSTIWVQPHDVLRVWIWFLSQADSRGNVRTAAPALSLICMVPIERMREILRLLESPDEDSRTPDHDGRRIERLDGGGGWRILNYSKYRESRDPESRREYQRAWDKENRPSGHARTVRPQSDHSPTQSELKRPETTKAEAEAEAEDQKQEPRARKEISPVVQASILLNERGCRTTPANPNLIAAIAEGVTPQALADLADMHKGKPAGYVIQAARGQLADGARPAPQARGSPADRPSKMVQALAKLEAMKNGKAGRGLVQGGNLDGPANAGCLESG